MKIILNPNGHYHQRVEEYLGHYDELDAFTYTQIAEQALNSTEEVELLTGETYRVCTLNGVEYGVGVKKINDYLVQAATLISPLDVEMNRGRGFKCTRRTVAPFNN